LYAYIMRKRLWRIKNTDERWQLDKNEQLFMARPGALR
jgi:hypothetical protein